MLTDTECRNLKSQVKPLKKSDGGGLYLLVKPSGSKHWYMGYRFGGRQRKLSFGPYPVVTLVGARDKRDAANGCLRMASILVSRNTKLSANKPPPEPSANGLMNGWKRSAPS
jgi:hypothetical protein